MGIIDPFIEIFLYPRCLDPHEMGRMAKACHRSYTFIYHAWTMAHRMEIQWDNAKMGVSIHVGYPQSSSIFIGPSRIFQASIPHLWTPYWKYQGNLPGYYISLYDHYSLRQSKWLGNAQKSTWRFEGTSANSMADFLNKPRLVTAW